MTSLSRLFLIGFLSVFFFFSGSHSQLFASDQAMGLEHHGEDDYLSKEDLYSLEFDFMDTYMANVLFRTLGRIFSCWYDHSAFRTCFCLLFPLKPPYP